MLFGVLAERAKRTLFFSKLDFKLLIDRQQSFLVVALQAVNLLVAQLHYHAENMGGLRAEFIPFGALHDHRISDGVSIREGIRIPAKEFFKPALLQSILLIGGWASCGAPLLRSHPGIGLATLSPQSLCLIPVS